MDRAPLTAMNADPLVALAVPGWGASTPCTEIGWRLGRSAWGHGYASEAATAALATALGPAGLGEVVSFTPAGNPALAPDATNRHET